MKTLLQKLISILGHWLHGITGEQWSKVLGLVKQAEGMFFKGTDKLLWVKTQLAAFLDTEQGKQVLGGLSTRAVTWLIETAVGFLAHKK